MEGIENDKVTEIPRTILKLFLSWLNEMTVSIDQFHSVQCLFRLLIYI